MQNKPSKLLSFQGHVAEVSVLQGYDSASLDKWFLMFQDHYIGLRHHRLRKSGKHELQPVMMTIEGKLHLAWAVYNITTLVFSAFSESKLQQKWKLFTT